MTFRGVVGVWAAVLFVAACGDNIQQTVPNDSASVRASIDANEVADATTSTVLPLSSTAETSRVTSRPVSTGGLWFAPGRITAGAGGTLLTGIGGVARVTPNGVTTVVRADNIQGALATAGETWLAYVEPDLANSAHRLVVGTIGANGAATPRFDLPGTVYDSPPSASISAAGSYIAFLWRMPSGSNWNIGRLVVSADGGKTFRVVDTPTGGGIAISPSGSAVIVGGPGHDQIFASRNVLTEAFVNVTPKLATDQIFHDPIYVDGRFIALHVSRLTIPNITTVISSRDNGNGWAYSDFAGNAPLQLGLGTFQIASVDGMTVSMLSSLGACEGFKTGCTNTVALHHSTDAGKSFQIVASYVMPA